MSLSVTMSKFIFVPKSGIKCHFWGSLTPRCPLMPQRYDARIVFFVILEIGDMQVKFCLYSHLMITQWSVTGSDHRSDTSR